VNKTIVFTIKNVFFRADLIKPFTTVIYGISYPRVEKALALPTNIRLEWKGLSGINSLAYYENQ
jgi:hypothetical protein